MLASPTRPVGSQHCSANNASQRNLGEEMYVHVIEHHQSFLMTARVEAKCKGQTGHLKRTFTNVHSMCYYIEGLRG